MSINYLITKTFAETNGRLIPCGGLNQPACGTWSQFLELFYNVIEFVLKLSIPIAVLVLIWGGFLLLTAGGSEKQIKAGQSALIAAIVGLAIVFGSYIIVSAIIEAFIGRFSNGGGGGGMIFDSPM